jgi:diguanylate cyclase (GGDEF)-like protein/PAS domain S-box-containing protein
MDRVGASEHGVHDLRSLLSESDFLATTDLGVILFTRAGTITACNERACEILGVTSEDLLGRSGFDPRWRIVDRDGAPYAVRDLPGAETARTGKAVSGVIIGIDLPSLSRRWLSVHSSVIERGDLSRGVVSVYRDVTEEVRREQMFQLLTSVTSFMAFSVSELELLQRLCDTLVRQAGFALAWVGLQPADGFPVDPVVASGSVDFLHAPGPSGPAAETTHRAERALRAGRTIVANDLLVESEDPSPPDRVGEFDFRSQVAIPFRAERSAVLSIYDRHANSFDQVTIQGLEEVLKYVELAIAHVTSVREREDALKVALASAQAQRETEVARADIARRFQLVLENSMSPSIFTDVEERVIAVNDAFCELIGRSREELIGANLLAFVHPDDMEVVTSAHRRLEGTDVDRVRYTKRYVRSDGRIITVEVAKSRAVDETGTLLYYVRSEHDVTQERALSSQLSHQALHDPLTGLANRVLFEDRLSQAHSRSQRHGRMDAVLLFDLDDFQGVNDVHGHFIGDEVITSVARRLESQTRPTDTLSRFGGDEFLYLAEGLTSAQEAHELVERLMASLEAPLDINGLSMHQRASVGVAIWDSPTVSLAELIQQADVALYQAKSLGRARSAFFTPTMQRDAVTRYTLTQELGLALANNEIAMYFQPIVNLTSLEIEGFEALMRWRHPTRGFVAPSVFIPLAESSDLIIELGDFALRQSAAALASWDAHHPEGPRPYMAVNCSATQFHHSSLLPLVRNTLAETRLGAERLVLEVTESVTLIDTVDTLAVIDELHRKGVGIALDDFGTGFSSLSYLNRLEPDYLKIDQSFVNPPTDHANADVLLEIIVALANKVNIVTLAEGIETREHLEKLRELGCRLGQGYLFSPAVPAQQAAEMLGRPFVI